MINTATHQPSIWSSISCVKLPYRVSPQIEGLPRSIDMGFENQPHEPPKPHQPSTPPATSVFPVRSNNYSATPAKKQTTITRPYHLTNLSLGTEMANRVFDSPTTPKTDSPFASDLALLGDGGGGPMDAAFVDVCLASEAFVRDTSRDVSLGAVTVYSCRDATVVQLRKWILVHIARLPDTFIFLTKHGSPVSKIQETSIKVSQIITNEGAVRIQKSYDKQRVGIKSCDGQPIGFIFMDLNAVVTTFRQELQKQLDLTPQYGSWYQFIDRCDWPISHEQESLLTVLDIIANGSVQLRYHESSSMPRMLMPPASSHEIVPRLENLETHQILISYVRAEAAEPALMLKKRLASHGYSIYLDVHEIKSGIDWQDALNYAVLNCGIFVPLITPRYGETLWTNREVKLADVLKKYILPINLLDHWPPKCLAIQFATTQYIKWNAKKGENQGHDVQSCDIQNMENVERVAKQIESHMSTNDDQKFQKPKLQHMVSTLKSCPVSLPNDMAKLAAQDREGKPLVVISIHPEQKSFGVYLKKLLEAQGYEVWCSSEDSTQPLNNGTAIAVDSCNGLNNVSKKNQNLHPEETGKQWTLKSQLSLDPTDPNLKDKERRLQFQKKADEAGVIIFVLSEVFAASKMSKQHVFYSEHRKRVISLRFEEFCMPAWMSMLIGTGVLEDVKADGFAESLIGRVKRCLDPTARNVADNDVNEAKIKCHVDNLKKRIPAGLRVYISGGTHFYHKDSEEICGAIGESLAGLEDLQIVTGGFYGVGEKVGHSYQSKRERLQKTPNIWHILPERDDQDRSKQAKQNKDKTFPIVAYGKTVYSGDSVREREVIVSRAFDVCILVEGGPGAAHEAEQFCWNDHVVIPVKISGGAASGMFNVPDKVFEIPPGVADSDWKLLGTKTATPSQIGEAVSKIVNEIKFRLKLDSPSSFPSSPSMSSASSPVTPGPLTPMLVTTPVINNWPRSPITKAKVRLQSVPSISNFKRQRAHDATHYEKTSTLDRGTNSLKRTLSQTSLQSVNS